MLLLTACTPATPQPTAGVQVVVTIPPLADWCRVLLGPDAAVTSLLRPGRSPHGYEPTPQDVERIAGAAAVVGWGGSVDDWLAALLENAAAAAPAIWLYAPPEGAADHADGHNHAADTDNPHTWLDPSDARQRVALLATQLAAAFPERAAHIEKRATAYDADLAALEERMARAAAVWDGQGVVTLHAAWPHFLNACGLRELGVVHRVAGIPPSAKHLAHLTELLRAETTRVIVVEPQLSPALGRTLAREIGAQLIMLDPVGGRDVPGYDTYLATMHSNLDALAAAFGSIPNS